MVMLSFTKSSPLVSVIVPVTETMPPGKTYQTWLMNQLNTLEQALATATGK